VTSRQKVAQDSILRVIRKSFEHTHKQVLYVLTYEPMRVGNLGQQPTLGTAA